MSTIGTINIAKPTFFLIFLDTQIYNRLLISIIYSRNPCIITFFLIRFDFINNISRQIFQSDLFVCSEKLLAINQYLRYFFTIDRNLTVFYFYSR